MIDSIAYSIGNYIEMTKTDIVTDALNNHFGNNHWNFQSLESRCKTVIKYDKSEEFYLDNVLMVSFNPVKVPKKVDGLYELKYKTFNQTRNN